MRRILLAVALLTVAPVLTDMAHAQQAKCGKRDKIVAMIQKYDENQTAIGLASTGELVEVFVSPKGSFTILITTPQGMTCIATIGNSWDSKPKGTPL